MFKPLLTILVASLSLQVEPANSEEVNVYSARKEALIKPLLDKFTAQTGIKVNLVTGKADALISRAKSEGKLSPADLLLTTDVGRLVRAKNLNITQAVSSDVVEQAIPENLRDAQGHWFSLTMRARPIIYSPDRVNPDELSSIEGLTDAKWKGRVCIRSSGNIYNQSMVAAMIEQVGVEVAQSWANDFIKSFARPPKGGDRDQIKAVAAGQCDIAVANTYYLAGMLTDDDKSAKEAAGKVKVFWPNQEGRGAHVNVSGAAIMKNAPNVENAKQLLEFMASKESQAWYAKTNHEYPIVEGVEWSDVLKAFGTFKAESITLSRVGELNGESVKVMDRAGWK